MNNYSMVMDVLAVEHDWRKLAFQIAKTNPSAVVESAIALGWKPRPDFRDECRQLARSGNKIEAIKLYRAASGLGLKEAKDAVDNMLP